MKIAALVLVASAVFFFSLVAFRVLSSGYHQYRQRYLAKSLQELDGMFLFLEPKQLLLLNLSAMVLLGVAALLVFNPLGGILGVALGFFLPRVLVRHARKRRVRKFNVQLVDALQSLANAFRVGLTFPQAVEQLSREMPAPLSQEFGLLIKEIKLGVSIEDALVNLSARVGSEDLDLVVVATNIARQLGGNMAEIFETLSATARERFRLEGKIDAITSQGRMQGWMVSAMPLLLGVVLNYMRPDLIQPMLQHPFGYVLVGMVLMMEGLGFLLIRRIVNVDV
jgi:tight adherence protein B